MTKTKKETSAKKREPYRYRPDHLIRAVEKLNKLYSTGFGLRCTSARNGDYWPLYEYFEPRAEDVVLSRDQSGMLAKVFYDLVVEKECRPPRGRPKGITRLPDGSLDLLQLAWQCAAELARKPEKSHKIGKGLDLLIKCALIIVEEKYPSLRGKMGDNDEEGVITKGVIETIRNKMKDPITRDARRAINTQFPRVRREMLLLREAISDKQTFKEIEATVSKLFQSRLNKSETDTAEAVRKIFALARDNAAKEAKSTCPDITSRSSPTNAKERGRAAQPRNSQSMPKGNR